MDSEIPTVLATSSESYSGFPWPIQNCRVDIDYTFEFSGLRLADLDARWSASRGDPRLLVDFDFPRTKIGEIEISTAVDCPRSVSRGIVNLITRRLRNELNGRHNVHANGMDLDLTFNIDHNTNQLLVDLDTEFDVSSVSIDIDWSNVETIRILGIPISVMDRDDILGPPKSHSSMRAMLFSDALAGLADSVEDGLNALVPEGHSICSLTGNSSSMEMKLPRAGLNLCVRLESIQPGRFGPRFP